MCRKLKKKITTFHVRLSLDDHGKSFKFSGFQLEMLFSYSVCVFRSWEDLY